MTANPQLIRKEIETYFSELYKTKTNHILASEQAKDFQDFTETQNLPKLINDDSEQVQLEHE